MLLGWREDGRSVIPVRVGRHHEAGSSWRRKTFCFRAAAGPGAVWPPGGAVGSEPARSGEAPAPSHGPRVPRCGGGPVPVRADPTGASSGKPGPDLRRLKRRACWRFIHKISPPPGRQPALAMSKAAQPPTTLGLPRPETSRPWRVLGVTPLPLPGTWRSKKKRSARRRGIGCRARWG